MTRALAVLALCLAVAAPAFAAGPDAGQKYLEKAAATKGAVKTASGAVVIMLKKGTGAQPARSSTVKVHYTGKLIDGKVFDSSVRRGEPAVFRLMLVSDAPRPRRALSLAARGEDAAPAGPISSVDVPERSAAEAAVAVATARRGWLPAPRVLVATRFPLGLWRAWASVQPAQSVLVWPRPEDDAPPLPAQSAGALDGGDPGLSGEHFAGVRPYQSGDPRKSIAWRLAARSDTLSVKLFEQSRGGEMLLDYAALPASLAPEARLARLARWVLEADAAGLRYGLTLPGAQLPPGEGEAHRRACLDALALARV